MAIEEALNGPLPVNMPDVQVSEPAGGVQVQSPQVVEENKGLWKGFFQKMQQDPNFRQSVMMTGIQMLRSPQMGETGWDVAANALQGGVTTLQGLRERDATRKGEEEDRALKGRQVAVQERGAASQEKTTDAYVKATDSQIDQAKKSYDLKREELQEAIRSNQSRESISRLQAEADMLRAKAYSGTGGAGRTPAEIQKINMLTAQYTAQGMDEIQARARAIEYLTETGRAKTPADRIRLGLDNRMKNYASSMESLSKPLTNEMIQRMLQEEIALEKQLNGLGAPPAATDRGGPIAREAPPVDPQLLAQVQAAVQSGKSVDAIRQRIIQLGHDPAAYGL